MVYKISDTSVITAPDDVVFKEVIVGVNHRTFGGIGMSATTGYSAGGFNTPTSARNTIDKYPFATDENATAGGGSLTQARSNAASACSTTHAYHSAGQIPTTTVRDTIDKFPFSGNTTATDVGNLTVARRNVGGNQDRSNGYVTGGQNTPTGTPAYYNIIDTFPFATDANATDAGDLLTAVRQHASQSSGTHAYTSGGAEPSPAVTNIIQKFPFASTSTSSDVGDLTVARRLRGMGSSENGYSAGTFTSPYTNATIDKFPFSTDANATDVGDLIDVQIAGSGNGSSSTTHGYNAGGVPPSPGGSNVIQKFSFVTDGNATDVGDLTQSRGYTTGHQG